MSEITFESQVAEILTLAEAMVTNEEAPSDEEIRTLADAYASVHVSRRGAAQAQVTQHLLTVTGANMEYLAKVLHTFLNVSDLASKATRKVAEEAPEITLGAIILAQRAAMESLVVTYDEATIQAAYGWADGDEEISDEIKARVERMSKAMVEATRKGGTGTRKAFKVTLADLVADGTLPLGTILTGADGTEASVTSEGVTIGTETFGSLSKAAESVTGHETNGWAWFSVTRDGESVTVGSLRNN